MKFLHITDPHVVAPGESLYGLDPNARFDACIADIIANHADAEFCVITGDLVHAGLATAYNVFETYIAQLPMPVHLLIGNHDDREQFLAAFPHSPRDEHGFIQSVYKNDTGVFLFLDTHVSETSCGGYCERRCEWLRARLNEAASEDVYLCMHHAPFDTGIPALDNISLLDQERLADVITSQRNIRHLFFGHVHRPIAGSWRGIPFSTPYATAHQCALDLVEPTTLQFTHEGPAYGVVLVDADRVVVHHHAYQGANVVVTKPPGFPYE